MPKLVVTSHNLKSMALKNLAKELSKRVGYRVFRVFPDRVGRRVAIRFHYGVNKIIQMQEFHRHNVSAPAFALSLADAKKLDSKQVVVRQLVDASEGRGITIVDRKSLDVAAPLYTAYIPKKHEYRVHVWGNEVIDIQQKKKKRDWDGEKDFKIRNTANGYVFCRDGIVPPDYCATTALAAVAAIGRNQGAVDIIWNEKQNKCFVLEVNSRPGMEGTTVVKYADAIVRGVRRG